MRHAGRVAVAVAATVAPLTFLAATRAGAEAEVSVVTYRAVDLGTLGGEVSVAYALNDRDDVVGASGTAAQPYGERAFRWRDGVMTDLGTLGGASSVATDVNNRGDVVGYSAVDADGTQHAFLWRDGAMTDLGTLGGTTSLAYGINELGQVVGVSTTVDGVRHGFLWDGGPMADLGMATAGGINDRGEVAGSVLIGPPPFYEPYTWLRGTLTDLGSPGHVSAARLVNERGWVVVAGVRPQHCLPASVWRDGAYTDLEQPGECYQDAVAMNDRGQVLGVSQDATGQTRFVLWQNGVQIDLATRGLAPRGGAVGPDRVRDINNRDHIVGTAYYTEFARHATLFH